MRTLLVINSSGRSTRSVTRHLTDRFVSAWARRHPDGKIIERDVGLNPPPPINESWIAAGFTPSTERTPAMWDALATSEALIDELFRATTVVVGAPMYNFGMPAQLKAYVDQIVRVDRTFSFNSEASDPYQPLIPAKPAVIITSAGGSGYQPGGPFAHMNFLESHLETVFRFVGLTEISVIRVEFEEFKDQRFKQALAMAECTVQETVDRLTLASACSIPAKQIPALG
jgi:FMN-dependent NADH-azoreductase